MLEGATDCFHAAACFALPGVFMTAGASLTLLLQCLHPLFVCEVTHMTQAAGVASSRAAGLQS